MGRSPATQTLPPAFPGFLERRQQYSTADHAIQGPTFQRVRAITAVERRSHTIGRRVIEKQAATRPHALQRRPTMIRRTRTGTMGLLLTLMLGPVAWAQTTDASETDSPEQLLDRAFRHLDTNQDGRIDRTEFGQQMPALVGKLRPHLQDRWGRGGGRFGRRPWQGRGRMDRGGDLLDSEGLRPMRGRGGPLERLIEEKVQRALRRAMADMPGRGGRFNMGRRGAMNRERGFAGQGRRGMRGRGPGSMGCFRRDGWCRGPLASEGRGSRMRDGMGRRGGFGVRGFDAKGNRGARWGQGPGARSNRPFGPRDGSFSARRGRGQAGPPPTAQLVRALDSNSDGKIDALEIARASESLKTLDRNRDGVLDPSDLPRRGASPRRTGSESAGRTDAVDAGEDRPRVDDRLDRPRRGRDHRAGRGMRDGRGRRGRGGPPPDRNPGQAPESLEKTEANNQ